MSMFAHALEKRCKAKSEGPSSSPWAVQFGIQRLPAGECLGGSENESEDGTIELIAEVGVLCKRFSPLVSMYRVLPHPIHVLNAPPSSNCLPLIMN